MDPEIPDSADRSARLQAAAARLEVYRHERLAYTEPPAAGSHPRLPKFCGRFAAFWQAVCHWVISR